MYKFSKNTVLLCTTINMVIFVRLTLHDVWESKNTGIHQMSLQLIADSIDGCFTGQRQRNELTSVIAIQLLSLLLFLFQSIFL